MEYKNKQNEIIGNRVIQINENNRNTLIQSYNIKCEPLNKPEREDKVYKNLEVP